MIYFRHFDTVNWWNTIVSIVSIIIIAITPRFSKKIPGSLIAIIVVTVAVYLMKTYGGIIAFRPSATVSPLNRVARCRCACVGLGSYQRIVSGSYHHCRIGSY